MSMMHAATPVKTLLATVLCAAISHTALAAGLADQITVVDPYVRMTPPGARATAAFMQLKNAGEQDVALVKADSVAASVTELHTHINDNGVMRMRQVKEIVAPAKGAVALQPSGYHVMLIGPKAMLKEGDQVVITLGFADGSSKEVSAPVVRPSAAPMQGMKH